MEERDLSRISLGIHTVAGIVAGYVSYVLANNIYALGAAILILLVTGYATEFALKKKGIKWWLSNGAVIYILVWLVSWIYLFMSLITSGRVSRSPISSKRLLTPASLTRIKFSAIYHSQ